LPIVKRGELVPKQPCGVKTSSNIKSSVSGGKEGSTANFPRKSKDIYQGTLGLATGGAKDLKPEKLGRKPWEEGGSWRRTMSGGEPSIKEENKERNTSQLPQLLC